MSRKDSYAQHETLRAETRKLLQKSFPAMSIYTRHVGMFYIRRVFKGTIDYTPIQIEKKGRCDDWVVLPCIPYGYNFPLPIHMEIETKTGKAVLNPHQIKWRDKCYRKRILWFENRNAQQTVNNINCELNKRGLTPWTIS